LLAAAKFSHLHGEVPTNAPSIVVPYSAGNQRQSAVNLGGI
jgi:hypothetical protein